MRLPNWLRTKASGDLHATKSILRRHGLSTVCEEARCPNIGVCFSKPTATFMILGDRCTRACGFCSVSPGPPARMDHGEPERIAMAAQSMGLRHVVVTSVTRDDLLDGGASRFSETIGALRRRLPGAGIEVLTPDFRGEVKALRTVLDASPDVFGHNIETVKRLYGTVRPQAVYEQSLDLLARAAALAPQIAVKSGIMIGLGETFEEVVSTMEDIRSTGSVFLTIGQYLRPGRRNLPVVEYVTPEVFDRYREVALRIGFRGVSSGPLVRSSFGAEEMFLR